MAFAYQTRAAQSGLALEISAIALHLVQRVTNYLSYRTTIVQLSKLSDAQLEDMGLCRADIHRTVTKSIYGNRR